MPRLHSVDGSTGGMILKGQPKYPEETCPTVILPTTNSTRTGLGPNLGLQGKKQTNFLNHGMAEMCSECCTVLLSWLHHKISRGHTEPTVYIIALVFLSPFSDPLENLVIDHRNCNPVHWWTVSNIGFCVISGFHSGIDED